MLIDDDVYLPLLMYIEYLQGELFQSIKPDDCLWSIGMLVHTRTWHFILLLNIILKRILESQMYT